MGLEKSERMNKGINQTQCFEFVQYKHLHLLWQHMTEKDVVEGGNMLIGLLYVITIYTYGDQWRKRGSATSKNGRFISQYIYRYHLFFAIGARSFKSRISM